MDEATVLTAEELPEFNRNIVGQIEITAEYNHGTRAIHFFEKSLTFHTPPR
jgi:hypothetical protein